MPCRVRDARRNVITHYTNTATWSWHLRRDSAFSDFIRTHDENHRDATYDAFEICVSDVERFLIYRFELLPQPCEDRFSTVGDDELGAALCPSGTYINTSFDCLLLPTIIQMQLHRVRTIKRTSRTQFLPLQLPSQE